LTEVAPAGEAPTKGPLIAYLRQAFADEKARAGVLLQLYFRVMSEKLWQVSLPGFPEGSFRDFVRLFDSPHTVLGIDPETKKYIGLGTLFDVVGLVPRRRASVSYCFFRDFWGTKELRECARRTISVWFKDAGLSVIYGAGLKRNGIARSFAKNFGFEESSVLPKFFPDLPGDSGDAVMLHLTSERWAEWLASQEVPEAEKPLAVM